MRKALFPILCVLCIVLYSCKDNVICPAFQSTYILSDSIRMAKYSLFLNDSTPKMTASSNRNKYGINKKSTLFEKNYDLKTAPKVNVLDPKKPESLVPEDEGVFLAEDFVDVDSLGGDSVSMAPMLASIDNSPKYKYRYSKESNFNQDQVYYNKYYGELFIDKRPAPMSKEELAQKRAMQLKDSTQLIQSDSLQIDAVPVKGKAKKEKKDKNKESKGSLNNEAIEPEDGVEPEAIEEEVEEIVPEEDGN